MRTSRKPEDDATSENRSALSEEHEYERDARARHEPTDRPRLGGYRVAGDLEIRSKELEQEVTELRARQKEIERELWSARRQLRASRARATATAAASKVGLGALLGSVLGVILYFLGLVTSPPFLLALVVAAGLVSMLIRDGLNGDKDDGFPPAPPPRMF